MNTIDATPHVSVGDGATLFSQRYLFVKFSLRTNTRKMAVTRGQRHAGLSRLQSRSEQGNGRENAYAAAFSRKLRMTSRHRLRSFPASGAKGGADHFRQLDLAIRLGKQQNATVETPVLNHGVFLVARRIQYLERRPAMQGLNGQLPSADRTRHHHVGEQKIDFSTAIDDRQSLNGVARGKRAVTEALN